MKFTSGEVPSKPNNVKLTSRKGKIPPAPVALNPIVNSMGRTLNQVNFVLHSTYYSLTFSYLRQFGQRQSLWSCKVCHQCLPHASLSHNLHDDVLPLGLVDVEEDANNEEDESYLQEDAKYVLIILSAHS